MKRPSRVTVIVILDLRGEETRAHACMKLKQNNNEKINEGER